MSRSKPWVMRTYAGHSSAAASNELYRLNLAKGQTGLSIAFDLPTQTGYDPDSPLARGEVGKVGVPVAHVGDMRTLLASEVPAARAAIDLYVYRIGRELGSLAAALGGLDALVFTAGIGEHGVEKMKRLVLRRILDKSGCLGHPIDFRALTGVRPDVSKWQQY